MASVGLNKRGQLMFKSTSWGFGNDRLEKKGK